MKSFERSGFWWDPREPERRWPGTLRFDSVSGAVLTLTQPFDLSRFFSTGREFPLMHGETTGMGKVTLVDSFERGSDEIFANAVIDGFHAAEPDPPVWVAAAVIERLNDWWNKTALSNETSIGGPEISIRYDAVQPIEVHSDSDMRVTLHSWPLPNVDRWNVSVKEEIRIEFSALKPIPLSVFRRRVHACQDLLSVATLSLCNVEDFRFIPAEQNGAKAKFIAHHYAIPVFRDPSERWVDGLFRYDDIASRPRDVFGAWFENAERLSAVRSLYLSAAYGKGFLELKLLAFTQAAEAYHRGVYEGKDRYMDEAEYLEKVLPVLQAAIPDAVSKPHRDSLRKRLRFANELSFRNRMKALFREHEAAMAAVVPNPCDWIERIVDYRNTLTHHPVAEESPSTDKLDLVQCNYVLRILLECCFLKSMSLTADEIKVLADRNGQYKAIRSRFFESKHTP